MTLRYIHPDITLQQVEKVYEEVSDYYKELTEEDGYSRFEASLLINKRPLVVHLHELLEYFYAKQELENKLKYQDSTSEISTMTGKEFRECWDNLERYNDNNSF